MGTMKVLGTALYQWEIGRKICITPAPGTTVSAVHFAHPGDSEAPTVTPREENGLIVADIPNYLLQSGRSIVAFLVDVDENKIETTCDRIFSVINRPKPADYVYTETEVQTWHSLDERIKALEENGMGVPGGSGITDSEKNLLLSLFKNTAYTADMSATISRLEALWSGNVPDVPDEPVGTAYTVTNNLTNVTNSNPQTEVTEGFYSATLRAEDGYTIEATITMGGVDITANVFTAETGTILITAVTGNIVITATAKLASMPVLYRLAGTPKSVSGLEEDTGLAFGSNDASGVANAWSICVAYTGFGPSETLLKMSSGSALNAATNGAGNNSKIRITCCANVADALSGESANNDYRFVITREKSSLKMISIHYLENGAVKTVTNTGTYGQFNVDVQAGNLLVGSSDIMVNDLTIYKGVLSDAAIAEYLGGGEI